MAKLNAAARRKLPSKVFAGPGRSFPIPDKGHAKAALGRINNAPPSARPKIRRMAEAKLKGNAKGGKVTVKNDHDADDRGYARGGTVRTIRRRPAAPPMPMLGGAPPQGAPMPLAKGGRVKVSTRRRAPARRKK